jgi:hypothetical protein
MSNLVFVLDSNKRQLDSVHPGKARRLLSTGKAAVFRRYPFTIILKQPYPDLPVQDLELKLDRGSKVTGIAIVHGSKVIFGAEFEHRGPQIKDAAAVNSTRWALFNALKQTGLPVATGTGGQTKFNRTRLGLPKTHGLDAASVGKVDSLTVLTTKPLLIAAKGHGNRQMCGTDKYGFPTRHPPFSSPLNKGG